MAQAFSDQGEGLVLRSEPFRWEGSASPHVPRELARDLMERVVKAYTEHVRQPPRRVVVHKKQRFWDEERAGMRLVPWKPDDLARRLGENARRAALDRFHIDRFAREWEETFALVTGRTPSGRAVVAPGLALTSGGGR